MPTAKFGWPLAADLSAFDGDTQMAAIYAAVEARLSESVSTASGLPVATTRPHGHLITARDTNVIYQATPSGWVIAADPSSEAGSMVFGVQNNGGTIGSATFVTIPTNPLSVSVTVAQQRLARLMYRFQGVCTGGTMDGGLAVSGATTVGADSGWTGAAHTAYAAAYSTVTTSTAIAQQYHTEKIVRLNAGSNTITAQARLGGAGGTKTIAAQHIQVELL